MPKLIDGDALISRIEEEQCKGCPHDSKGNCPPRCALVDIRKKVHELPTIDAVEVVRCKDCRFFVQDDEENGYCDPSIWAQSAFRTIYDFCSKGLKRDAAD